MKCFLLYTFYNLLFNSNCLNYFLQKEIEDLKYELELIQRLDFQNKLTKKYKQYRKKIIRERKMSRLFIIYY